MPSDFTQTLLNEWLKPTLYFNQENKTWMVYSLSKYIVDEHKSETAKASESLNEPLYKQLETQAAQLNAGLNLCDPV